MSGKLTRMENSVESHPIDKVAGTVTSPAHNGARRFQVKNHPLDLAGNPIGGDIVVLPVQPALHYLQFDFGGLSITVVDDVFLY